MADRALDVIAAASVSIEHSRWPFRLWYLIGATTALILLLGWAIHFDKSTHVVSTLAWMIVFCATLTVVTPSAEQMTKMLAQVAAIRAGAKVEP